MKKLFSLLFVCLTLSSVAQPGMYRHFPQTPSNFSNFGCEVKTPIKTADGGYVFGYLFWCVSNSYPCGPFGWFIVKTDSNFVPQWQKPNFSSAIALPSGGIILVTSGAIEKVTASGVQLWRKELSSAMVINAGINYSNKIRLVGKKAGIVNTTYYGYATSQAYSCLMDTTSGTLLSQNLYSPSYSNPYSEFSKIERDQQGNFFVYSSPHDMYMPISNMILAKFDSSFTFLWGKTFNSSNSLLHLNDIDVLPNGRIMATGYTNYSSGVLLKMDSQGNIISQSSLNNKIRISGLCKKQNGNYVVSMSNDDSLFLFETDTSFSISWNKFCGRGRSYGTSIVKNNTLVSPLYYGIHPLIISNDLTGNSCKSFALPYSQYTPSLSLTSFSLSPLSHTATAGTGTTNLINSQVYVDSCKCSAFIQSYQKKICVGQTGTVTVIGTGNLSWYNTAIGNSFIQPGPQYLYSSNTPTTLTVFVQDSICTANPQRTQVSLTVVASPNFSLFSSPTLSCNFVPVTITAQGASSYTWSNGSTATVIVVTPTVNTTYTVSSSNGVCQKSNTLTLAVLPSPTVVISTSASDICIGENVTLLANGALSYSWNTGSNVNIIYQSPTNNSNYTVTGTNSFGCTNTKTIGINVHPLPLITLSSNQASICLGETSSLTAIGANTYTWNSGSTSANIIVSPTVTTTYSVLARSVFGCENNNSITQYILLCTDDMKDVEQIYSLISVYPNPTNSYLEVVIYSITENSYLELVNTLGQIILSQKINDLKSIINLSSYNSGIYYLNLYGQDKASGYKIIKY
jgi:hypothetical protein